MTNIRNNSSYIEPTRKAKIEQAELGLRDSLSGLGFGSYAVNLNTLTKTVEVVTGDPSKNTQVQALFGSYSSDIPITM